MKKMKKVLSLVLVLIMVLSLFPVAAFAEFNGMLGSIWEPGEDIEPLPLPTTLPEVEEPEEEEAVLFDSVEQTFYVEDENGVAVDVEAPAGALPMGADLVVSSVAPETIQADVDALLGAESNVLLAMDISFVDENGNEVHPAADVKVMLSGGALADKENLQVVHFPDETLAPELVNQLDANDVAFEYGTNVAFQSKDFSVYAVVDPGEDGPARDTYKFEIDDDTPFQFFNTAGDKVDNQIIKNGEYLEDVGLPTIKEDETFLGWYLYDKSTGTYGDKIEFGVARSVAQNANHTFYVRPKLEKVVYLTFYNDEAGSIIKDRVQVIVTSGTTVTYDLTTKDATPPNGNLAFVGWTDSQGGEPIAEATAKAYPVTANKNFLPVFKSSHWLSYFTAKAGAGATYIAPSHVLVGHKASETMTTEVPKVKGYTFRYWTTVDQSGNWSKVEGQDKWVYNVPEPAPPAFNADQELSKDTTLYAVWENAQSSYRVIIWHQSIDDNWNAPVKTYEQFSQDLRKEAATERVYTTPADRTAPTGFLYNAEKSDTSAVVSADGTTILNVYFDRKLVTMTFTGGTVTPTYEYVETTSTRSGNYYYQDDNGEWVIAYFYYSSYYGSWYIYNSYTYDYEEFSGTPCERVAVPMTFTGLYGQPLSKYNYTWPEGTWNYNVAPSGTKQMSYLGQFIPPVDALNGTADSPVISFTGNNPDRLDTIEFYLMETDGETYPDNPSDIGHTERSTGNNIASFYFSEKYDGFNVTAYRLYTEDSSGNRTYYKLNDPITVYYVSNNQWKSTAVSTATESDEWIPCSVDDSVDMQSMKQDSNGPYGTNHTNSSLTGTRYSVDKRFNLEIRYARKSYTFSYLDSIDGNPVLTSATVYYQAPLTPYKPTAEQESTIKSQTPGKQFDRKWYKDQGCQTEFDWNATMPNAEYQAYAGWEDIWYWIKVDPDGGEITEETTGATWFWNTYGEPVTEYNFVKREYVESDTGTYYYHNHQLRHPMDMTWEETEEERAADPSYAYYTTDASKSTDGGKKYAYVEKAYDLLGWYVVDMETGETTDELFNFDTTTTSNIWIRAKWHRNGDFPIKYSAAGVGKTGAELLYDNGDRVIGSGAPTEHARYDDGANSAMLIACTAPQGYVFLGWYYAGKVYDPGEKFVVDAAQANDKGEIVIYAVYEKINSVPVRVTHITWYDNFTENPASPANYKTVPNLQINKAIDIESSTLFTRPGYRFLGWARVDTTDADYKLAPQNLDRDDLYLTWHEADATHTNGYYTVNHNGVDKEVTQVAADETLPYHDMYAVWQAQYYVYHTGSGRLYTYDVGHPLSFNVNADGHVVYDDYNFLYGGYSTSYYAGLTNENNFTEAQKSEAYKNGYTEITDYIYRPSAYKTITPRIKWWKNMAVSRISTVTPQAGEIFFVKEVPETYLTSRIQFVYENWAKDDQGKYENKLEKMYFLSVLDDRLYDSMYFSIKDSNNLTMNVALSFTIQGHTNNPDVNPVSITVRASDFKEGLFGYVGFADANEVLSAHMRDNYFAYFNDEELNTFTVQPCWETKDHVVVTGTPRVFTFHKVGSTGVAKDDYYYATCNTIGAIEAD